MKLQEQNNQEIIIGGGKQQMFGIDTSSPIIFDILRNKMYSNKIGAVAREIASNSRDANRESGTDKPVEIEFTTTSAWMMGDVSIIFRDFGIGISPDRMEKVFLMYAASTKRDSNEQTGGFGLGAKTPFAYTDSFIIRTVNEEIEYVYNAIIDNTGNGKMILLSEELAYGQPSGTEIIIPILSSNDRATFEKEVYKATSYWTNIEYINFNTSKPEVTYALEEKDFKIVKHNGWGNFVGLVDGIPYEIRPTNAEAIADFTVMFNLDLSEITINANRESLQYDEKTVEHVNAKYELMKLRLKEIIEKYLDDNKTYKEAFLKQRSLKNNSYDYDFQHLLYNLNRYTKYGIDYKVRFNGDVVEKIFFKHHMMDKVVYERHIERSKYTSSSLDLELPVVYLDEGRLSTAKNKELNKFLFIRPIKGEPADLVKAEFEKIKEITEGDFQLYSQVKLPAGVSAKPDKRDYITLKVRSDEQRWYSKDLFFDKKLKTIRDVGNVAFVPVYSIAGSLYTDDDKVKIIRSVLKVEEVYFINQASYEKHLKPNGYKTVQEMFATVDLKQFSKFIDIVEIKNTLRKFPSLIVDNFPELLPKSYAFLASQDVVIPKGFDSINWYRLGVRKSAFDYNGVFEKFKKKIDLNYPLLFTYIDYARVSDETKIKNVKNYINLK